MSSISSSSQLRNLHFFLLLEKNARSYHLYSFYRHTSNAYKYVPFL